MTPRVRLVTSLLLLLLAVAVIAMPTFSGATFSRQTSNAPSTVGASADWTPPTVSLASPGSPLKGAIALSALAADGETGIASVVIQQQVAGFATWTTICTLTIAPYTCTWNTPTVADGTYDLRAIATDGAGYTASSAIVRTVVANSVLVVLGPVSEVVRGSVPLSASIFSGGSSSYTMRFEYALTDTTQWRTACTASAAPYTCTWSTTSLANDYYDIRAVAVSGTTSYFSAVAADTLVDNLAPVVSMTDPGSPLSGFITLAATASDAHSGVANVVIQAARTGTTSWVTQCTIDSAPFTCRVNSALLVDGSYAFRAIATDNAGNVTTSASVLNRLVDNTVSSVSLVDPGLFLRGTVTLTADAASTAGVSSVTIQRSPAGAATWSTVCAITTAPYSCPWDTTTVADGSYDLRAVLVDGSGRTSLSAVLAGRIVDNTPLRGYDVQAVNGGALGKIDVNDTIVYTFNDVIATSTVTSGWTGAAIPVSVRIQDGNVLGLGNSGDTIDVLRSGSPVALGSVALRADFIKSGKTAVFNATMTASTAVVDGQTVSVVSIRLVSIASGGALRTPNTPVAMVWSPSGAVADLAGNKSSTSPVTELPPLDRDF